MQAASAHLLHHPPPPLVPDHDLIRVIGQGGFGEVWLARARPTGRYRAVKVVRCNEEVSREKYELELQGVKLFEEISREHEGFMDILHLSHDAAAGCFFYVMELADDARDLPVTPESARYYRARTLEECRRVRRLPPAECLRVGLALAAALAALHERKLVHCDIKPANIIYVRNQPKLGDIGLVAEAQYDRAMVAGTPGYMDPSTHGTVRGGLFSLGKTLYVIASGRDANDWPTPPPDARKGPDAKLYRSLEVYPLFRACHGNVSERYRSAADMLKELEAVRAGVDLEVLRRLRLIKLVAKGGALTVAALVAALAVLFFVNMRNEKDLAVADANFANERQAKVRAEKALLTTEMKARLVGQHVARGTRALEDGDPLEALPSLAAALHLEQNEEPSAQAHRLRLGLALDAAPRLERLWFRDVKNNRAVFTREPDRFLMRGPDGRWAAHSLTNGGEPGAAAFGSARAGELMTYCPATGEAVTSGIGDSEPGMESPPELSVWDAATGREKFTVTNESPLRLGVLSPDGRWLAAATPNNDILIWDRHAPSAGAAPVHRLKNAHSKTLLQLVFSPESRRLLAAGQDQIAQLWEVATARLLTRFTNHWAANGSGWVYDAAFHPGGRLIATCSFERKARVWDAATGLEVCTPLPHQDGIYSVQFSPDGEQLLTAELGFTVRVWAWRTGKILHQFHHHARPVLARFSPDGQRILATDYDGTTRVWSTEPRAHGRTQFLGPAAASGDGLRLARRRENEIALADTLTGEIHSTITLAATGHASFALNFDGSRLALVQAAPAGGGFRGQLWHCANAPARLLGEFPLPPTLALWSLSESGDYLWESHRAEAATGPAPQALPGGFCLQAGDRQNLRLRSARTGELLPGLPADIQVARFSPGEDRLALTRRAALEIWNVTAAGATAPHALAGHSSFLPRALAWDAAGGFLVGALYDNTLNAAAAQVWDTFTGALLTAPGQLFHRDGVRHAAFSPAAGGPRLLTCGEDFEALLWSRTNGWRLAPQTRSMRHPDAVVQGAFSADGARLVTAARNRSVRVWDAATSELLGPPLPFDAAGEAITHVTFLADGGAVWIRFRDGNCWRWQLTPDPRPTDDLRALAELLSSQQVDNETGPAKLSREKLEKRWRRLEAKYPEDFAPQD